MLIVKVKEGENLERALKRYKRKFNETHVVRELRERQAYKKPGEIRRKIKEKAAYKQRMLNDF